MERVYIEESAAASFEEKVSALAFPSGTESIELILRPFELVARPGWPRAGHEARPKFVIGIFRWTWILEIISSAQK